MSDVVISVENLSKRYLVGHEGPQERYHSLRDTLVRRGKNLARKTVDMICGRQIVQGDSVEEFWALKDVSFEVKQGEVLGIIGRNGAGKSTLLKILSRITEPSAGRVELEGRVASLLEVGTGFHPELTGRENIFLNGAILGMHRAEIREKFDEIVAFAEVEKFLDTPVKRYSSGMYVRLAFAVAAHLEPEILIVDEVLAVGDTLFQRKCLGKMQEVSADGRTVLFVSHQMAAIQNLCRTGLHLSDGRIVQRGDVRTVICNYSAQSGPNMEHSFSNRGDRKGTGLLRFRRISFGDSRGSKVNSLIAGSNATIEFDVTNTQGRELRNVRIAVGIDSSIGERLLVLSTHLAQNDFPIWPANHTRIVAHVPKLTLTPGRYNYTLFSSVNGEIADWIRGAGSFDVEAGDFYGTGQLPEQGQGVMLMEHRFEMLKNSVTSE